MGAHHVPSLVPPPSRLRRVCARTLPSPAAAARNVGCAPLPGSRMKTAQEDRMRMRSTVVGKLWARILLALAAGAITGFVSLHRAQSGAVQATPPDLRSEEHTSELQS